MIRLITAARALSSTATDGNQLSNNLISRTSVIFRNCAPASCHQKRTVVARALATGQLR